MLLCHSASWLREKRDVPQKYQAEKRVETDKGMEGEMEKGKSPTVGGDDERGRY